MDRIFAPYAPHHFRFRRIRSREVNIGGVPLGGDNPIRIQSMTTTDTMDTLATVEQSLRMVAAGSEYIRITAPSKKEAQNLAEIKKELRRRGCEVPLVADIHYTPNAAEIAARIVSKVRVNPGNYADKKRFQTLEYTDASYQAELERIYERFSPLVKICKEEGTVMRIGTNHGSLSDRIMSRYGDTPQGMVESAMEFVRICEDHGFYDIVISMKASNPQVMVQAYRLLMQNMQQRSMVYPTHLGVTEAGEGEDGRIKSALGISTLLLDGIGDTVRVSLTEDPEHELPVAQFLIDHVIAQANQLRELPLETEQEVPLPFDPFSFKRQERIELQNLGGDQVPRVVADIRHHCATPDTLGEVGYTYVPALDKYNFSDIASDYVYLGDQLPVYDLPGGLKRVFDYPTWHLLSDRERSFPLYETPGAFLSAKTRSDQVNFVRVSRDTLAEVLAQPAAFGQVSFVLHSAEPLPSYDWRYLVYRLHEAGLHQPVILQLSLPEAAFSYFSDEGLPEYVRISEEAKTQLALASNGSTLLVDGLVDGLWIDRADHTRVRTAFGMLQLARLRITKTEYISCPSCGRTLFDLQETTARIRKRTEHLKGVKIGIMGCIVNGPGEMADADYGYVGVGPGKISLYRGQEVVKRNVQTAEAVDALIDLIREDGKWVEPAGSQSEAKVASA
ncbi:MAG: 4-hydroxy-3-methylbut-2-en-1-yl diphosphate synthase [Bacteroidetes bacterium]|nr:MAG: 4-hydroxy-3-methylbut-2-en-1-yl diphosphate synthase [Bacteroidota bacterium]